MYKISLLIQTIIIISFYGCQTSEQIRRERLVDDLSSKVIQSEQKITSSQKYTGDLILRIQNLEDRVNLLQGGQEEAQHASQEKHKQVEAKLLQIEEKLKEMDKFKDKMDGVTDQLEEQKKFLEKVLSTLESVQKNLLHEGRAPGKSKKDKKKDKSTSAQTLDEESDYEKSLRFFKEGDYEKARSLLVNLMDQKGLSTQKKNRVIHNLGMIEYKQNNVDNALIYFSKIYTKHPDSSLAPESLLHIGKILHKSGKKDEAKEAFSDLIKKYPKSSKVNEAKSELQKLN